MRIIKHSRLGKCSGLSFVEMMVSMGIGSLLLLVIGTFIVYSARSFATMANYADLEYASRNALDILTSRIRSVQCLRTNTQTMLRFQEAEGPPYFGQNLEFRYIGEELIMASGTATKTLLKNCTRLQFDIRQLNTVDDKFDWFPTPANRPDECKVVQVSWTCSKPLFGSKLFNTEVVQTAKIVIRTK